MIEYKPNEFSIPCPWGRLASVAWGDSSNPPILLLHGYLDSAATFIPLIQHLPDSYYYVAIDLPGHGKSDHFHKGVALSVIHFVESVRIAVKYLNWSKFIFIGHSMAGMIGLFYDTSFPGEIAKMIMLDPVPPLSFYNLSVQPLIWAAWSDSYYSNYHRYNHSPSWLYTYEQIVNAAARSRNLSEEQAQVVMSRSIEAVGDGKFRMTMDQRVKKLTNLPLQREFFVDMLSRSSPKLLISASDSSDSTIKKWAVKLLEEVQDTTENFLIVYANGGHDLHITNPEGITPHIVQFLERDFKSRHKAKL